MIEAVLIAVYLLGVFASITIWGLKIYNDTQYDEPLYAAFAILFFSFMLGVCSWIGVALAVALAERDEHSGGGGGFVGRS